MDFSKLGLALEFVLLFVALPLGFRFLPVRVSPLPALWAAALYCYLVLRSTPGFSRSKFLNASPLAGSLGSILLGFLVAAILVALGVWIWRPQALFGFMRTRPFLWAFVMLLYPVFSVYPQGIVYRAFIFERYRILFPSVALLILFSAAAFAFSHIIFRNPWSVVLTFIGGALFAWRYQRTDSLLVSSLEHALYGCYMFTVGLGGLFYHGAVPASSRVVAV
jgi:membrane protease YdiL (CAAX protease family)